MAQVALPYTLTNGTDNDATQVMANLQAITAQTNGNLDLTNVASTAQTAGGGTQAGRLAVTDGSGRVGHAITADSATSATSATTATNSTQLAGETPGAGANQIVQRDASGNVPGNLTGNAATATTATTATTANGFGGAFELTVAQFMCDPGNPWNTTLTGPVNAGVGAYIDKVSSHATYFFEAVLTSSNGSYTASAALYDSTGSAQVASSTLSTTGNFVTLRSGPITLTAGHLYNPVLWISNGAGTASLYSARVVAQI